MRRDRKPNLRWLSLVNLGPVNPKFPVLLLRKWHCQPLAYGPWRSFSAGLHLVMAFVKDKSRQLGVDLATFRRLCAPRQGSLNREAVPSTTDKTQSTLCWRDFPSYPRSGSMFPSRRRKTYAAVGWTSCDMQVSPRGRAHYHFLVIDIRLEIGRALVATVKTWSGWRMDFEYWRSCWRIFVWGENGTYLETM